MRTLFLISMLFFSGIAFADTTWTSNNANPTQLEREIRAIPGFPANGLAVYRTGASSVLVYFAGELSNDLISDVDDVILAHVPNVVSKITKIRSQARRVTSLLSSEYVVDRAITLTTIDEVNILRAWVTALKAEIVAASTLADLKNRVSTSPNLPNLPNRTAQQAKTAIENKIDSGGAD